VGVAFTIGLSVDLTSAAREYFSRFSTLPPRGLAITSTTVPQGPVSFETLVGAIAASTETAFAIVVHGHEDGSGLFLPLANRGRNPVGARTTHDQLTRLDTIASRTPRTIDPRECEALQLRDAEIDRLVALMQRVRAKDIQTIEFRGCNLGRNRQSVAAFRRFFGARSFGAPNLHSFFGLNPVGTGADVTRNHTASHQGTTHTYERTFDGGKRCLCCTGVDGHAKPQNGHIVADDDATLDRWIQENFQAGASRGRARRLPVHGLWRLPDIDPNDPLQMPNPRPIFPLAVDGQNQNEYAQHVVYSP
jgi:hypothetical protein